MTIIKKIEGPRGCGYRVKGGTYLVADGSGRPCHKLPIPLTVCPCCGEGIKFSRGFTWVTAQLFIDAECNIDERVSIKTETDRDPCIGCPLNVTDPAARFGLLWVGDKFYSANEFRIEAMRQGISKRIGAIPRGFKVGETWILLAHIKGGSRSVVLNEHETPGGTVRETTIEKFPAIFHAFKPSRIEYVVTGLESEAELNAMEDRGITLVEVIRDIDLQQNIEFKT